MAGRRCRRPASLGITRDFSRLYPTVGMIAVALLTLTPLALRPVRLACLIHAANVHSEPGSNPSKCGRRPEGPLPSPKGRGFLTGRTGPGLAGCDPRTIEPAAGFVKTVPTTPPAAQTSWATECVPSGPPPAPLKGSLGPHRTIAIHSHISSPATGLSRSVCHRHNRPGPSSEEVGTGLHWGVRGVLRESSRLEHNCLSQAVRTICSHSCSQQRRES